MPPTHVRRERCLGGATIIVLATRLWSNIKVSMWVFLGSVSCSPTPTHHIYTNKTHVAFTKSTTKHMQKSDLLWFRYGYRKCLVSWLLYWIHWSSQLCSLLSVE